MSTPRRLSDSDVRSIFESLHEGKVAPKELEFKIVPVARSGQRLSPPDFEYEQGLYVLTQPVPKSDRSNDWLTRAMERIPDHLKDSIIKEFPDEGCRWSLSGPQFPTPTAIQQRYCYPKGRTEYASKKGASLWTIYTAEGKEDMQYRLLHVYFSAKRALNRGLNVSDEEQAQVLGASKDPAPPRKRRRFTRKGDRSGPIGSVNSARQLPVSHRCVPPKTVSPTMTNSTTPGPEQYFPPPYPYQGAAAMMSPADWQFAGRKSVSPPIRDLLDGRLDDPTYGRPRPVNKTESSLDSFQICLLDAELFNEEAHGPLSSPREFLDDLEGAKNVSRLDTPRPEASMASLMKYLELVHRRIRDGVGSVSNKDDQGRTLNMVTEWARQLAASPLQDFSHSCSGAPAAANTRTSAPSMTAPAAPPTMPTNMPTTSPVVASIDPVKAEPKSPKTSTTQMMPPDVNCLSGAVAV